MPTSTTVAVPAGLRRGDSGPAVLALQRRLDALGYFSGELDATFGWSTHHAVVALQKVLGATRDGVVSSVVQDALDRGERPTARSTTGRVVEIDLVRQVLLVVDNGVVLVVLDTSTGRVRGTTPVGHWRISRQIDGLHRSPLGLLYRPKYFYRGVAIHGYTSVPPRPASHGCVRITYAAMDMVWARSLMPVGTAVWVY